MTTLEIKGLDLHASDPHQHNFNVKRFYEQLYKSECSSINFSESFDLSLLEYCFEKFTFIYHSGFSMSVSTLKKKLNFKNILNHICKRKKPNFYFFHNECVIILGLSEKNEKESHFRGDDDYEFLMPETHKYEPETLEEKDENLKRIDGNNTKIIVTIHYPSYKFLRKDLLDEFKFLDKFKIETAQRNFISVLMKNPYGEYDFEPLDIKVPKMDLELNYGEKFKPVYDKIIQKLKTNNKGLYMFHGEPGTGKSSFIKYLTSVVNKEFIFIPTSFIEKFISDPDIFTSLVKRKKCVIILEDAEKILISRERQDNEYISTILNLSDGILSDMIQASIVITYNCDETKIDKALRRKGRTMVDYKFDKLSIEDSKKLAKNLKFTDSQIESIKEPMSLSEIYNISEDNKFYKEEEKSDRIVGFGK